MTIAVFGGASPATVVPKEHTRVLDEPKHASIARFVLALQALDLPNSSGLDKCILIGFSQAASAGIASEQRQYRVAAWDRVGCSTKVHLSRAHDINKHQQQQV